LLFEEVIRSIQYKVNTAAAAAPVEKYNDPDMEVVTIIIISNKSGYGATPAILV